jgi:hypothetical protein
VHFPSISVVDLSNFTYNAARIPSDCLLMVYRLGLTPSRIPSARLLTVYHLGLPPPPDATRQLHVHRLGPSSYRPPRYGLPLNSTKWVVSVDGDVASIVGCNSGV